MKKLFLIGLAAVPLLALTACGPIELTDAQRTTTELGARDFTDRSNGKFYSCSGQDSDGDGYVTCNVEIEKKPTDLLCSYQSRGCKRKG